MRYAGCPALPACSVRAGCRWRAGRGCRPAVGMRGRVPPLPCWLSRGRAGLRGVRSCLPAHTHAVADMADMQDGGVLALRLRGMGTGAPFVTIEQETFWS